MNEKGDNYQIVTEHDLKECAAQSKNPNSAFHRMLVLIEKCKLSGMNPVVLYDREKGELVLADAGRV